MLKTVGCLLMIISGTGAGRLISDRIQKRYTVLSRLHDMAAEITVMLSALMTTQEILSALAGSEKYRELTFLSCDITDPKGRTWIVDAISALNTDKDVKEHLSQFFCSLGTSDFEHETAKARLLTASLEQAREELGQHYRSDKKLARVLGMMSGAFAAVILI